jgi:hypothetical protein
MTNKIYKTAQGKVVDMGALILQNESIRAVGNMNVNARGDVLDSSDTVIDSKNSQIRRQNNRQTQTNVRDLPIYSSTKAAKQAQAELKVKETVLDTPAAPVVAELESPTESGLVAAIAKSRQNQIRE